MKDNVFDMARLRPTAEPIGKDAMDESAGDVLSPMPMMVLPKSHRPTSFDFLLLPGASMLSFSAATEALRLANSLAGRDIFCWRTLSCDGEPVRCSNGMSLAVDDRQRVGENPDYALMVGGPSMAETDITRAANWLRYASRHGSVVGAISGGAEALARAGCLKSGAFTLHWESRLSFIERYPDLLPLDHLFCADDRTVTCSGGLAALDLVLHLISENFGQAFAMAVSDRCVHFGLRVAQDRPKSAISQTMGSRNPHLVQATRVMMDNLEEPLHLDEVAQLSAVSRRHLERLFKTYSGLSPAKFYRSLRLERGRKMLFETDYSLATIAAACGFGSHATFVRIFRQEFGVAPSEQRQSMKRSAIN